MQTSDITCCIAFTSTHREWFRQAWQQPRGGQGQQQQQRSSREHSAGGQSSGHHRAWWERFQEHRQHSNQQQHQYQQHQQQWRQWGYSSSAGSVGTGGGSHWQQQQAAPSHPPGRTHQPSASNMTRHAASGWPSVPVMAWQCVCKQDHVCHLLLLPPPCSHPAASVCAGSAIQHTPAQAAPQGCLPQGSYAGGTGWRGLRQLCTCQAVLRVQQANALRYVTVVTEQ